MTLQSGAKRGRWALLGGVGLIVLMVGLPTLNYPFRRDHGEFAATAQVILDGGAPYRDVWNPKPPAVFFLYSAVMAVAGPNMMAIRAMDLMAAVLVAVLLADLGWKLWGKLGGVIAGVGYGALYFSHRAEDLAQNDGFMTVVLVFSAVCFLYAWRRSRPLWFVAAGVFAGLGIAFKYPTGLWMLFLLGWLLFDRKKALRERFRQSAWLLGGVLAIWIPLALYLAVSHALPHLLESIRVTVGYTQLYAAQGLGLTLLLAFGYFFILKQFGPSVLAVASLAVRPRSGERKALYHFTWGWLLVALATVCVQLKFYDYHWLLLLPPLALLMGGGALALSRFFAWLLQRFGVNRWQPAALWLSGGMVLAFLLFRVLSYPWLVEGYGYRWLATDEQTYLARFGEEQDNYLVNVKVAEYVTANSIPADTLFIWGFEPVVYVLSDRQPATRFIYSYPLVGRWYPEYWRQEVVDQLRQSPPAFILILKNDSLEVVTGVQTDSATQFQEFSGLLDLVEQDYVWDQQIGNMEIYRHRLHLPPVRD